MKPVYPAPRALPSYENLLLEMVEPNILKVTLNRPKAYNALSHLRVYSSVPSALKDSTSKLCIGSMTL